MEADVHTVLSITCAHAVPFHTAPEPAALVFFCTWIPMAEPSSSWIGCGFRDMDKAAPIAPAEDLHHRVRQPVESQRWSDARELTKSLGQNPSGGRISAQHPCAEHPLSSLPYSS